MRVLTLLRWPRIAAVNTLLRRTLAVEKPCLAGRVCAAQNARLEIFLGRRGVFESLRSATAWRVRENVLCGYDGASVSPDFANGAITGAFSYAAGSIASTQTDNTEEGLASGASDCGSDAYACTRVNPDTDKAEIEYTDLYNKLDPIEQAGVTAHEDVHVIQIDNFINNNVTFLDRLQNFFDPSFIPNEVYSWVDMNRAALEMPAYNAQLTYLNTHIQDYGGVYAGSVSRMILEQTYTRDLIKSGKISGAGD
jgi:hypothetical protein